METIGIKFMKLTQINKQTSKSIHRFGGLKRYPTLASSKMENNYPYKPD